MELSTSFSKKDLEEDHFINLPGNVDSSGKDVLEEDLYPDQNSVTQETLESPVIARPANEFKAMDNEENNLTTSFSNSSYNKYDSLISNGEKQVTSLMQDPSRGDSLHVANDQRLENIDLTEQSLHQIARDGDVFLMRAVLGRLPHSRAVRRLNRKDADKFMPIHYAARYNHFDMCRLLLDNGANLHAIGEDSVTALHLVAKYKPKKDKPGAGDGDKSDVSSEDDRDNQEANLRVLDFLISKGARVNEKDFYGLTPLHHASLRGNDACVERLLRCPGINIEAKDKQLMTPLHICAIYGHVNIARILVDEGANFRCKDEDDGTPLQFAAAEGNLEIVKLIFAQCEKRSHLSIRDMLDENDNDGSTALHYGVDNGHLHITQYIIDQCLTNNHPAALNATRAHKETPLHIASRHGHLDIVELLVEKGAKINARNDNLQTPMFLAAQFNHDQIVEFLIKCGANIETHDTDSYTALLIAANYGHTETIKVLLEHKANVLALDKNDKSIVYMCAEEDRPEALQELLKRRKVKSLLEVVDRYENTPLHAAANNGNFAILKILLDAGSIIDAKNEDEQTPLHLAATNGYVKIVKELVKRRKDIIHDDDESANTPLHLAALAGRVHCVRELVRLGANIGARNAKQWTPLDCCASVGMHKCALVLLESDSPVDPKDKRKITPLHLACRNGHRRTVELLLEWNADVSQRSVSGLNALDFAIDHAQAECAEAIIASDKWREALQNRTLNYASDELIDTPMRKLIRKMPEVASQVFRKCMRDNGKHKDDPKYEISFDYEFLDDEYSCTHWVEVDDNTSEVNITIAESSSKSNGEVYDDIGKVLRDAEPYARDSSTLMTNHPLYVMVKSKRVNLMRHPLVISLLNHKWRAYGRAFYYVNLAIYMFFMAVLNSYMLTVPPPYAISNETIAGSCVRVVSEAESVWGAGCTPNHASWQPIARYIILPLAAIGLLKELFQILSKRMSYIKSLTNFIELALYILSILLVIDVSTYSELTGIREPWQWQCGSAALFFSWMGLLLFIQNFPKFGIFVLMFSDVLRTFISFFFVFALFILGFAFSFHVLLQNQFAFDQWWNSIIKTFVMMIGEFEYDGIFNAEKTSPGVYTDQLQYEAITYILFVVFMIIMSIIIMNLLVGLAVDDIKEVQDNAVLESLAMQVKLALDIEYTVPKALRRSFMKKYRKFSPNTFRKRNGLVQFLNSEEHLNHETIEEALNPEKGELQAMEGKIDVVQNKVRDLRSLVYGLSSRTQQIETITQAIAKHFDIKWDKDEDDQEMS